MQNRTDRPDTRQWRRSLLVALAAMVAVLLALLFIPPSGPRSMARFDPDRTAALELDMWQVYYAKQNLRLFRDLVTLQHEQYHYPWGKAIRASFHLARAAATFGNAHGDYERVLPDLERAYAIERDWMHAGFDPQSVARAELAWWVARRDPAQLDPQNVGRLIAVENAQLYAVPSERVLEASVLRARAGRLRDEGGERADWAAVASLLRESYRSLHAAVQP